MSHRCSHCAKAFKKSTALRQHVECVHVDRPRQRRESARRLVFASDRQMAIARGMVNQPPELLPFGGIGEFGGVLGTIREMLSTIDVQRDSVGTMIEPPTFDLVAEQEPPK